MAPEVLERNLAVSLRPRRFSEVIGYGRTLDKIRTGFEAGRIPTAMKFVGMSRGGKTTIARIIGLSVNCAHAPFGEPCDECIADRDTFEIVEGNAGAYGTVGDMRDLLDTIRGYPRYGPWRVIILDECQQMTKPAQNALLVPLEKGEYPNIFIFCTTDDSNMIPALQKRCANSQYIVDGLDQKEIRQMVWSTIQRVPHVSGEWDKEYLGTFTRLLWERGILAPGDIVNAVEAASLGATPEEAAVAGDFSGNVDPYKLCDAVVNGNWARCQELLKLAQPRDGDELRVRMSAFLRSKLLSAGGNTAAIYKDLIHEMISHESVVSGITLSVLTASIYNMCTIAKQGLNSQLSRAA